MSQTAQYEEEYHQYLARVQKELGNIGEGQYAKYNGRLVQRLSHEEFVGKWHHYSELRKAYIDTLNKGDTVNDAVVQMVDEHAAELLIPSVLSTLFKTGETL